MTNNGNEKSTITGASIFTCNLAGYKLSVDNRGKEYSIMQENRLNFSTGLERFAPFIAHPGEPGSGGRGEPEQARLTCDRCRVNSKPLLLIKLYHRFEKPFVETRSRTNYTFAVGASFVSFVNYESN